MPYLHVVTEVTTNNLRLTCPILLELHLPPTIYHSRNRELLHVSTRASSNPNVTTPYVIESFASAWNFVPSIDGPPAVVRVDRTPGFITLVNGPSLLRIGICICLEVGRIKNRDCLHVKHGSNKTNFQMNNSQYQILIVPSNLSNIILVYKTTSTVRYPKRIETRLRRCPRAVGILGRGASPGWRMGKPFM